MQLYHISWLFAFKFIRWLILENGNQRTNNKVVPIVGGFFSLLLLPTVVEFWSFFAKRSPKHERCNEIKFSSIDNSVIEKKIEMITVYFFAIQTQN